MIDAKKTYRTRDGREVRIYATDGGGCLPVQGAIREGEGWCLHIWTTDGKGAWADAPLVARTDRDLIEVKPRIKRTVFVNVFSGLTAIYGSREDADYDDKGRRLACIKIDIDCEEGEGLEERS